MRTPFNENCFSQSNRRKRHDAIQMSDPRRGCESVRQAPVAAGGRPMSPGDECSEDERQASSGRRAVSRGRPAEFLAESTPRDSNGRAATDERQPASGNERAATHSQKGEDEGSEGMRRSTVHPRPRAARFGTGIVADRPADRSSAGGGRLDEPGRLGDAASSSRQGPTAPTRTGGRTRRTTMAGTAGFPERAAEVAVARAVEDGGGSHGLGGPAPSDGVRWWGGGVAHRPIGAPGSGRSGEAPMASSPRVTASRPARALGRK